MKIMTEDEYLNSLGLTNDWGDCALHKNVDEKTKKFWLERLGKRDHQRINDRELARQEYQRCVQRGDIRPPNRLEVLRRQSTCHEDHESIHAARRLLEKFETRIYKYISSVTNSNCMIEYDIADYFNITLEQAMEYITKYKQENNNV